jgi:hypothetical protein
MHPRAFVELHAWTGARRLAVLAPHERTFHFSCALALKAGLGFFGCVGVGAACGAKQQKCDGTTYDSGDGFHDEMVMYSKLNRG